MLDSVGFLLEFTTGRSENDLRTDRGFRSAVGRELQIVGEALFALSKSHPEVAAEIPESYRIIRFRHVLVHGYDAVDPAIVWAAVKTRRPRLSETLREMVGRYTTDA
jgi:uncharacterized protein with HEPN domain